MTRVQVGDVDELVARGRLVVSVDGVEVAVFLGRSGPVAYENTCPHLGGPVGNGRIVPRVAAVLDETGAVLEERFAPEDVRLVCPWHGFEFDLETGVCPVDKRYRLRPVPVEEGEGELYVVV